MKDDYNKIYFIKNNNLQKINIKFYFTGVMKAKLSSFYFSLVNHRKELIEVQLLLGFLQTTLFVLNNTV